MSPPIALRTARRQLEHVGGIELLDDLRWCERRHRWFLHFRVKASHGTGASYWYAVIDPTYPDGDIEVFPAKVGGFQRTNPHQKWNGNADPLALWNSGALCLVTPSMAAGGHTVAVEPTEAERRLEWHVERAVQWVRTAAAGELARPGDWFELPPLPPLNDSLRVGYQADRATFAQWHALIGDSGFMRYRSLRGIKNALIVCSFETRAGTVSVPWGTIAESLGVEPEELGVWAVTRRLPILQPWHVPYRWCELREALKDAGLEFESNIEPKLRQLRDGRPHLLMLGTPVPERFGEAPSSMSWMTLRVPTLPNRPANGFRANAAGFLYADRFGPLAQDRKLEWITSENWSEATLRARGVLGPLAETKVAVVGLGALGSVVVELLAREGVRNIAVMDTNDIEAGNLCRHTGTLQDLGVSKGRATWAKLQVISPNLAVTLVPDSFPPAAQTHREVVADCDLVVDCTANDNVLEALSRFPFREHTRIVSASVTSRARRLLLYDARVGHFNANEFRARAGPWFDDATTDRVLRPDIGCWSPTFAARADDIWLWATMTVKYLVRTAAGVPDVGLLVYEQNDVSGEVKVVRHTEIRPFSDLPLPEP